MKTLKSLTIAIVTLSLFTGCLDEKRHEWWHSHPLLIDRAEEYCKDYGGIYE